MSRRGRLLSLGLAVSAVAACSDSPSRNILGAYFPTWMLCALIGIAGATVVRTILTSTGLLEEIPVPALVLLALTVALTFGIWLLWLS